MLHVKQGSCEYQLLKSFGLTRPGNYRLRSTDYEVDVLTKPHAGLVNRCRIFVTFTVTFHTKIATFPLRLIWYNSSFYSDSSLSVFNPLPGKSI